MNQRRYDIDALRSIAMFLLIFYHLGISFTTVAPYIAFEKIFGGVGGLIVFGGVFGFGLFTTVIFCFEGKISG